MRVKPRRILKGEKASLYQQSKVQKGLRRAITPRTMHEHKAGSYLRPQDRPLALAVVAALSASL